MPFLRILLPVLILGVLVLMPASALAANASFFGPIVSPDCHCENSAPDWGCVLDSIHNLFNLIFSLSVLIFAFSAAYAGILFMTSSTNAENKSKAKTMLLNVVIGLAIALSAWLMVDFIMRVLYNENVGWGPWNRILAVESARKCLAPAGPPPAIGIQITGNGITTDVAAGDPIPAGIALGSRVECNKNNAGTFQPGVITSKTEEGGEVTQVSVRYDDNSTEQNIPADRCRMLAQEEEETECEDLNPTVSQNSNVVVSASAVNVLKEILKDACIQSATITSGRRTPADQARIMYALIEANSVSYAKTLYGAPGDSVIDVYVAQKAQNKTEAQIRAAMEQKINDVGPTSVSKHISTSHDVFDVGPSTIPDSKEGAFRAAIQEARSDGKISSYIFPPTDPAYHIEIEL